MLYLGLDVDASDMQALGDWLRDQRGRADRGAATAYLTRKLNGYVDRVITQAILANTRREKNGAKER